MKRNKITLAVLIVLFVCQFAFASTFQSADKAGTAAVWQHAAACDALENMKLYENDPFAFFLAMTSASDEYIDALLAKNGINAGYTPYTSAEVLDQLFPIGIEETTIENAVRRTALQLAWCYGKTGKTTVDDSATITEAVEKFNLVGYDFLFTLSGKTVVFNFVDIYSKDQINKIGECLMSLIPGAISCSYPSFGKIVIETNGLTEHSFAALVKSAEGMIYGTMF